MKPFLTLLQTLSITLLLLDFSASVVAGQLEGRGVARVAVGEKRIALVIGNDDYRHLEPLHNPRNDAQLIADTLQSLGFELIGGKPLLDLDKAAMDSAVQNFGHRLGPGVVALFYYAGHGVEHGGVNYLLPINANPTPNPADLNFQALNASFVLSQMESAGTSLNVVILDACRNNPFGGSGLRDISTGLAAMKAPEGSVIAYSTQPGNVALDGPKGGNSPYATALAFNLSQVGLGILDTFNAVAVQVKDNTGVQEPWASFSGIKGQFYFSPPKAPVAMSSPENPESLEQTYWKSIEKSQDPEDFKAYLNKYGDKGQYADLAKIRLKHLQAKINNPDSTGNAVESTPMPPINKPTLTQSAQPNPQPPQESIPFIIQNQPVIEPPKPDPAAMGKLFWESIKNSRDPEDFNNYLKQCRAGRFPCDFEVPANSKLQRLLRPVPPPLPVQTSTPRKTHTQEYIDNMSSMYQGNLNPLIGTSAIATCPIAVPGSILLDITESTKKQPYTAMTDPTYFGNPDSMVAKAIRLQSKREQKAGPVDIAQR